MKRCGGCGLEKPLDAFYRRARSRDGRQSYCKACNGDAVRRRYATDPESYSRSNRVARERATDFLRDWLGDHPCVDCGEGDIVVLEFDHVRGEKAFSISAMLSRRMGLAAVREEIAKCDVVCANCHRRRTYSRGGCWRLA